MDDVISPAGKAVGERSDARFALAITAAFLACGIVSIVFHEPWRDEAQGWLLARDSTGLGTLLRNCRYEGVPVVWHLLLMPLTRVGWLPLMSALNLAFAAGAVFLFARFFPSDRVIRALFAFGYLPLYEWGTVARNYSVGLFFLFLFVVLYRERRPILQGAALAVAANTSIHAAIVAAGALALLVVLAASPFDEGTKGRSRSAFRIGLCLAATGLLLGILQSIPPFDVDWSLLRPDDTHLGRLRSVLYSFEVGLAPFLDWWFASVPSLRSPGLRMMFVALGAFSTGAFAITVAAYLARRRSLWIFVASSVTALAGLFFFALWRGPRHAGFFFVTALIALWLAPFFPERQWPEGPVSRGIARIERAMAPALRLVLVLHFLAGGCAVFLEATTVFSGARATATLMRQQHLAELPVVIDPDFLASSIVAHLDLRSAYYPNVDRWGSFARWSQHLRGGAQPAADDGLVFDRALALAGASDVVVVLNRPADESILLRAAAVLVGSCSADVVLDENYWIYRIPRKKYPQGS